VTIVRDPVSQAVSAFFHARGRSGEAAPADVAALAVELAESGFVRAPLRWFDREFAPALGIDVYAHPFDPVRGTTIVETPSVRVLVLRQESLAAAPGALAGFLGLDAPVPIPPRNAASDKPYAAEYEAFVRAAALPSDLLERVYSSRYARHFYAADEIAAARQRWSGRSRART
jgi:hypothetical protein